MLCQLSISNDEVENINDQNKYMVISDLDNYNVAVPSRSGSPFKLLILISGDTVLYVSFAIK